MSVVRPIRTDEETDLGTVEPDLVVLAHGPERGCVADLVVGACVVGAVVVDACPQLICLAHVLAVGGHEEPFVEGSSQRKTQRRGDDKRVLPW